MELPDGRMAGQRCRDIDRRLAVDAELAARIETLQRGSDEWTASDRDDRDASEIRQVVASCARSKQFRALRDDIRAGRVAVFVGPQIAATTGLPDGQQVTAALASRLAQHLHADDPHAIAELTQLGPQALSDLFIHHFGRPHFFQAVNEVLHADRRADELRLDLHEMILEIPFALIASTTWDDLFERAGRQLTPPVFLNAITNDEELLSLYTPHGPLLIQPRGSSAQRERPCGRARPSFPRTQPPGPVRISARLVLLAQNPLHRVW